MAVTWTIESVTVNPKRTDMTITFIETLDTGESFGYHIMMPDGATKNMYLQALKAQVLEARALRAKVENLKAQVDSAALEAFINS